MYQYNKTLQKMTNYDDLTRENINKHNPIEPQIIGRLYRILIIGDFVSEK